MMSGNDVGSDIAHYRVGVIGTYGSGNLGDESIFLSFVQWLKRNAPHLHPVALCVNPAYIEQVYGLPSVAVSAHHVARKWQPASADPEQPVPLTRPQPHVTPAQRLTCAVKQLFPALIRVIRAIQRHCDDALTVARYLPEQVRVVRGLDAVLVLGGGQVHDFWDGPLGHPATLYSWSLACRLGHKPYLMLSVGAVELRHNASRWLVGSAFRSSIYASVRDETTAAIVRTLHPDFAGPVVPDLAWGLQCDDRDPPVGRATAPRRPPPPALPPRRIGVCPMVYRHPVLWPSVEADASGYGDYIANLAAFCSRLSQQGYVVVLFPTQIRSDTMAIRDLTARMDPALMRNVRILKVASVSELLDCLASVDAVVSSRFHGLLLAMLLGRPAISLSYQPKNDALLDKLGYRHFALDIHGFSADALWTALMRLSSESSAYAARIQRHVASNRAELDQQYRDVLQRLGWVPAASDIHHFPA